MVENIKKLFRKIVVHKEDFYKQWHDLQLTNDLSLNSNCVNDLIQQFLQGNGPLRHPLNEESK